MSWYYSTINGNKTKDRPTKDAFRGGMYSPHAPIRNIVYTMRISDMKSLEDGEKLKNALLEVEGISEVNPILHQNKLAITFNPTKASISNAARIISELGYHYTKRGCRGCQ